MRQGSRDRAPETQIERQGWRDRGETGERQDPRDKNRETKIERQGSRHKSRDTNRETGCKRRARQRKVHHVRFLTTPDHGRSYVSAVNNYAHIHTFTYTHTHAHTHTHTYTHTYTHTKACARTLEPVWSPALTKASVHFARLTCSTPLTKIPDLMPASSCAVERCGSCSLASADSECT